MICIVIYLMLEDYNVWYMSLIRFNCTARKKNTWNEWQDRGNVCKNVYGWRREDYIMQNPYRGLLVCTAIRRATNINYIISGRKKAVCDGEKEQLFAGNCDVCKKGSSHSIINTGDEDLVMPTVVVKR